MKAKVLVPLLLSALALVAAALLLILFGDALPSGVQRWAQRSLQRSVSDIQPDDNLCDLNLSRLDLRNRHQVVERVRFNLHTRWPAAARMPDGFDPGTILTNAMNPGLGLRGLHQQGITGKGVGIGVIDFRIFAAHPEYREQLAGYYDLSGQHHGSMHGPAVASLAVGQHIGTAPGASLYFVATPDPGSGAQDFVQALDLLIATNTLLPPDHRIRVVSVSASPDGDRLSTSATGSAWEQARQRAEAAGILVLDCSRANAFIGPCNYSLESPDVVELCKPVPARGRPGFFAGHLLVPVAPRTTAEAYYDGDWSYQFCGRKNETFLYHGVSWAIPYCAGVLALGWQIRPDLQAPTMKALLVQSAHTLPTGEKVIDPPAFIRAVRATSTGEGPGFSQAGKKISGHAGRREVRSLPDAQP